MFKCSTGSCFKNCHLSSIRKTFKMRNKGNKEGGCVCVSVCTHNYIGLFSVLLYIWELLFLIYFTACTIHARKATEGARRGPTGGPPPQLTIGLSRL